MLRQRILNHALANRHRAKWKRILHALNYGASLRLILTGRFH